VTSERRSAPEAIVDASAAEPTVRRLASERAPSSRRAEEGGRKEEGRKKKGGELGVLRYHYDLGPALDCPPPTPQIQKLHSRPHRESREDGSLHLHPHPHLRLPSRSALLRSPSQSPSPSPLPWPLPPPKKRPVSRTESHSNLKSHQVATVAGVLTRSSRRQFSAATAIFRLPSPSPSHLMDFPSPPQHRPLPFIRTYRQQIRTPFDSLIAVFHCPDPLSPLVATRHAPANHSRHLNNSLSQIPTRASAHSAPRCTGALGSATAIAHLDRF
jgi:hypothetical protein